MTAYNGFRTITMSDAELSDFYSNLNDNKYECLDNEYLIIANGNGEAIDYFRWSGDGQYIRVIPKTINNGWSEKIKPRNAQQVIAIDMLLNTDITVKMLTGAYGAGKDYLMSAVALELIKKNKYERIIWIRNNWEALGCKPLGTLPGDAYDKLLPFVMPLADHVGGIEGLEMLIHQRKIEIVHMGHIRGRDFKNSILYTTEVEDTLKSQVQLLLGRVGEGSVLWMNGDYRQTDDKMFEKSNGLLSVIDKLKGHHRFGFVHMPKTERSETASMADLLDD